MKSKVMSPKEIEALVKGRVDRVMRAGAMEATGRIMQRTPVDTGRARANWNASVDEADGSVNEAATDSASKQAQGQALAASVQFADGEKFVLANGLPYIERLEAGSSTQAPAGMVELTLAELKPFIESAAEKVGRDG